MGESSVLSSLTSGKCFPEVSPSSRPRAPVRSPARRASLLSATRKHPSCSHRSSSASAPSQDHWARTQQSRQGKRISPGSQPSVQPFRDTPLSSVNALLSNDLPESWLTIRGYPRPHH